MTEQEYKNAVLKHIPLIRSIVYKRVYHSDDVPGRVQDILAEILLAYSRFRNECNLQTWIVSITYRQLAAYYRKKSVDVLSAERIDIEEYDTHADQYSVETTNLHQEQLHLINKFLLASLSSKEKALLEQYYIKGYSQVEIAHAEGKSLKSIESKCYRLQKKLQMIGKKNAG